MKPERNHRPLSNVNDSTRVRPLTPAQELPPGTHVDHFTIVRTLGQGGFGITYLAHDDTLDTHVVIKENLPSSIMHRDLATLQVHPLGKEEAGGMYDWAMQNFLNEARTLAKLDHPNIVKIKHAFPALGTAYFVMPHIAGASLEAWRALHDAPEEAWLRRLLTQLLDALSYLHGENMLHRDIKPDNILLTESGKPLLIDFGTARQLLSEKSQTVVESAGYTPIEQMQSHARVDARADIYALGCTLYTLITGERPQLSADRVGADDPLVPLCARPELKGRYTESFLAGIDKAMALWPEKRWQSAADWARALEGAAIPQTSVHPAPPPVPAQTSAPGGTRRLRLWLVMAMLLIALGVGAVVWNQHSEQLAEEAQARRDAIVQKLPFDIEHDEMIGAVAWSPDGLTVATGDRDGKVWLWDVATQRQRGQAMKHVRAVYSVAWSPDGLTVATGDEEGKVCLWDVATGKRIIGQAMEHGTTVRSVAFSPDGRLLATGGEDNTARLWDVATQQQCGQAMEHEGSVYSVAFSPDGRLLATEGGDNMARLWDVATQQQCGQAMKHESGVSSVVFSPDGRLLATGCEDGKARLWEVATGKRIGQAMAHADWVNSVAFSPDGRLLATGDGLGKARLWEVSTQRQRGQAMRHEGAVHSVAFSPDGRVLATGGYWDKTLCFYPVPVVEAGTPAPESSTAAEPAPANPEQDAQAKRDAIVQKLPFDIEHDAQIISVAWSPDGLTVATGDNEGKVWLWEVATGKRIGQAMGHRDIVFSVAFSPDGRLLATGGWGLGELGEARLWEVATQQQCGQDMEHGDCVFSVAFSPDGRLLATGGRDKKARLWEVSTQQQRGQAMEHGGIVWSVAFSPDGRLLATGGEDEKARLWDVATQRQRGKSMEHGETVWSVAFSPDGRLLATGSADDTARLWEVATQQQRGQAMEHGGTVHSVAFSPDGRLLATGGWGLGELGEARLWEVDTQQQRGQAMEHEDTVRSVAFSPDGRVLATGSRDKILRFRPVPQD